MTDAAAPPPPPPPDPSGLQFDKAESADAVPRIACGGCQAPLEDQYYTAGLAKFCPACRQAIVKHLDEGSKAGRVLKAALLGALAALIGGGLWALFIVTTNWMIGLVAIGLGYLVGIAVRKGSDGRGGRAYQVIALVLCYMAVATGYMGVVVAELVKKKGTPAAVTEPAAAPAAGDAAPEKAAPVPVGENPFDGGCVVAFIMLLVLYVRIPIDVGKGDPFTFLFLAIALWEAWRLNTGMSIAGPFRLSSPGKPAGG